jgi:hypothetical protein
MLLYTYLHQITYRQFESHRQYKGGRRSHQQGYGGEAAANLSRFLFILPNPALACLSLTLHVII